MRARAAVVLLSLVLGVTPDVAAQERTVGPHDRISFEEALETAGMIDAWDPLESLNRRIYWFNYQFDRFVFLPAVRGYEFVLPGVARTGIKNFFANLGEIPVFINSVLQLKGGKSIDTAARFGVNSTFGVAGVFDVATRYGKLPAHNEDFGQTLGHYGLGPGPFLVVPIMGPSSFRDGGGLLVDTATVQAINLFGISRGMADRPWTYGVQALDLRANTPFRYGDVGSPFEYDLVRFLYLKRSEILAAN